TRDGTLLIPFLAHDSPVKDFALIANHIWLLRSNDGGRHFAEPIAAAMTVVHGNRGDALQMLKGLSVVRLVMDTARGSPYQGRLYLGFLTVLEERLQVMVATSRDTGRTWLPAVKVNDDAGVANHSNPAIAVDTRGVLAVVWNDRRADPSDLCFRATASASLDGGATFLPNAPIMNTSTCPLGPEPKIPLNLDGFAGRYLQGGETQGLAPRPGGGFLAVVIGGGARAMQLHAAWIDVRSASDQH
ncbi:MAG: sialidase family protein, partial [Pseudolysinimonas sp.]